MRILKAALILALLPAAFLPAKYNNGVYGYLPGLLMTSLLLLSLLHLFLVRRSLRVEIESPGPICRRGENVDAALRIENRSFLSCPKVQVTLSVSGFFAWKDSDSVTSFFMGRKGETRIPFPLKMNHLGVYTFGVKELRVYDPLGIFSIAVHRGEAFRVTVLPKLYSAEEVRLEEKLLEESRNLSKSAVSDGFDHTGVREYALGDPMKRIHWKLSAHSSTYMTRITESSRKNDLTVMIDFVADLPDPRVLPCVFDCLVETALSLVDQAQKKDVEYSLLFVGRDREIIRSVPKGEQDYESLIQLLPALNSGADSEFPDGAEILEKEGHLGNRSSNLILCTSRYTDQLVQGLTAVKRQQRNPELCYIIPPGLSAAEEEMLSAQLEPLDESGVRYRLVTAEAEPLQGGF